ncbi:hypothetical protein FB451DRAFT_1400716 [Mycena latifolia]|nr:hypothetical protein FB451DRAFT_1400716 [Mycena latifolia]
MLALIVQHALRLAPAAAKALAALVFLLNVGSWPLVWHFRVFSSVIEAHVAFRLTWLRHLLSSKEKRAAALEAWHEARMPVGVHPFRKVWTYASWVSVDDSDFNLHMSNSSYAKALDSARFRLALATFPNIFRCGGWVPLAATHYHFIREIPMLSRYEVRAPIGAWDDKWPAAASASSNLKSPAENAETPSNPLVATLKKPATSLLETPSSSTTIGARTPATGEDASMQPDEVTKALLRGTRQLEPDGSLLYTCATRLPAWVCAVRVVPLHAPLTVLVPRSWRVFLCAFCTVVRTRHEAYVPGPLGAAHHSQLSAVARSSGASSDARSCGRS